jgi:basic membrane protein A
MARPLGRVISIAVLLVLVSACAATSASPTATPHGSVSVPRTLTVGLVTDVDGLHDRSYNALAFQGLKEAAARWRIHYQVLQPQSVNDYIPDITRFVTDRVGLIVTVGFSMRTAVYEVASVHPEIKFALVDATPVDANNVAHPLSNVSDLYFKEQESGYLVGVIAGLMEKDHVGKAVNGAIGYVGGAVIPQVTHYLAGYIAGARAVDPSIRVVGDYAPGFVDPQAGQQIGNTQITEGADVLFQVAAQTGQGYLQAAQRRGVYGIGVDTDQSYLGPEVITSAVKKVDVAVRLTIGSVIKGTFSGGDHRYGLKEGATGFAPPRSIVPRSIVAQADDFARRIARGQITPPLSAPQT